MKKTNMVTVVYCLTIKFPTSIGVGYMKAKPDHRTLVPYPVPPYRPKSRRRTKKTPIEPTIRGDVLAIDQRPRFDITLDSLDPREEYLKPESVG